MKDSSATDSGILPSPIRIETALSRYPVHRLAKQGEINIDFREKDERGEVTLQWRVTYNTGFGQPGPLAYKLDTLIVNRRIEEAPRPVPPLIRLGSHKDICREIGVAEGGRTLKQQKIAFHQNASSYITAKITYKAKDGTQRDAEIGDTRYAVVFTGEKLPDGRRADAIYIILHDFYRDIINSSRVRPLDYDYLKSLAPAPQRFYELLSYQMYATIKNDRPRAKLLYSELCTYAPLVRQHDWDVVRPQLARIHAPHRKSGYVGEVDFQHTLDRDGRPDWIMLYQPGLKARAEYRAFARRGGPAVIEVEPLVLDPPPRPAAPGPSPLEAELIGRGITPAMAGELVRDHGEEKVRAQLEHLDWLAEKKPGKIADPAAWLVAAIRNGHGAPKGFVSKAERRRREEARQAKERAEAEDRRRRREEEARERALREEVDAYLKRLTPAEREALEAEALAGADPEARRACEGAAPPRFRAAVLLGLVRDHVARGFSR
jgi:hypothetical protein